MKKQASDETGSEGGGLAPPDAFSMCRWGQDPRVGLYFKKTAHGLFQD